MDGGLPVKQLRDKREWVRFPPSPPSFKEGDVMYTVEIVWNREFTWSTYTTTESLQQALKIKEDALSSGDGARVKKARVLGPQGEIVG